LIRFVYGNQYSDIGNLTTLLWIMNSMNAGFRMLPMNILPALGYTRFNVLMSVAACMAHMAIDYFCILNMGIHGVAVAGCTVYLITGLCYWYYLRKKVLA
jgi:O-antigen/teichoic acid export membrane protein